MKLAVLGQGPEIFRSIQGEGASAGVASVFVRTSLCNLHCVWCDTDYTWNWEGTGFAHQKDGTPGYRKYRKDELIVEMAPAAVARRVIELGARNVVLTGGEPMLHQDGLVELMRALRAEDGAYRFEVETNGTIAPGTEFAGLVDQFNVSPKLANSGNEERLRVKAEVLRFFAGLAGAWFKFVITGEDDLNEVVGLVERFGIARERVILMPEGATRAALERHAPGVMAMCEAHGFRYGDRLHVRVWGDERGR